MKLRTKLAALFLLLSILPIIIVGYLAYDNSRTALEEATQDRLAQTNGLKSDELTRWIANNEAAIEALAQRPLVRQYTRTLLEQSPDASAYVDAALRLQRDHLLPALNEQGGFLVLSILSPDDGQIRLSTNAAMQGKYRLTESFFIEGRTQTFTQNPQYNLAEGGVVMQVGTPITDDEGALIAVLAGQIDFSEMAQIVSHGRSRTRTEETYLVNAYHFIMTNSRFDSNAAFTRSIHTTGVNACLEQNDGVDYYDDYRGVAVVGAYQWLAEHKFCILTEIDQREAFAPVYTLRDRTVQIGGVVSVLFALLGLLFARTITIPIQQVTESAREIGRGNLNHRIQIVPQDEIGDLARAFNEMAANLRHSLSETAHGQDLMLALSEAAGSVQRARTPEDVYRAIGNEITRLGFHSMVFTLNDEATDLEIAYHSLDSMALTAAEEKTDVATQNWRIAVPVDSVFDQLLKEKRTVISKTQDVGIFSALPEPIRARFRPVADELNLTHAIYAPLMLDDSVIGILLVVGSGLSDADTRAVTTFAKQTAIALENTRLYEAVQRHAENLEQLVAERTAELQQEKQLSDDIVNSLPGIFLMYNEDGRLIRWNQQFEYATGYSADELAAMPVIDFADENQASDAVQQMQIVYEEGSGSGEFNVVSKDGRSTPYFFSDSRIVFGEERYVVGIGIDITERKHAEEALQESEARFRDLFNQMPIALMRTSSDATILEANPAAITMFGYPDRDSFLAIKSIDLYVDMADRAALGEKLAAGEVVQHFETRFKRYDGRQLWIQLNVRSIQDAVGWDKFFEIAAQDITERKQIEAALRESEARLRDLYNQTPIALMRSKLDGSILEANPATLAMLGYPDRESLLAANTPALYTDFADREALITQLAKEGFVADFETRVRRYDGKQIWVQVDARSLYDSKGRLEFLEVAAQDITKRKQAEQQLAESMAELERSNEELEQFAYVASHDLQEPLRMVTSYLQLLERRYKGQLDDNADTYIYYATDGAARMKRLIQDLLVYSRVNRYGKPPEPVSARSVVEQALKNLQAAIEENEARITYDALPDVLGDETQLVMLFQNLVGNAIKFRGDDAPEVRIAAERNGAMWQFEISDNGIGIEPEYFDRIFIIFQRLHSSRDYRGTGIGLAVCKKIVERHDGDIWIDSSLGNGTTFYFTLPAQEHTAHE